MRVFTFAVLGIFAIGCSKKTESSKKSLCEEARDLHVSAARQIAKPMAAKVDPSGNVVSEEPEPAAMTEFEKLMAKVERNYVRACEKMGAEETLRCAREVVDAPRSARPLSSECETFMAKFRIEVESGP
jgi:hypothetical protein